MPAGSPDRTAPTDDERFMAAAIRLSRKNAGLTSTNPSVGTLIVSSGVIVGRGVTAIGGRPHAEAEALAEAGQRARGATAYVTLEPCAHHGRTPPCANALVAAGIARVVGAAADPDPRVSGRGYAILRSAGVDVVEGVLLEMASDQLAGYLTRSVRKRPEVTIKLAISADEMIGERDAGQVAISGAIARRQVQMMRAEADAILIGIGTAIADDPLLTVRLSGLGGRSPMRIVLDRDARLPLSSRLLADVGHVPLMLAIGPDALIERRRELERAGAKILAAELYHGRIALPELLDDLGALGVSTVLVEGGAKTARAFLEDDLVERLALFRGRVTIGPSGITAPVDFDSPPAGFIQVRQAAYGADEYRELVRSV